MGNAAHKIENASWYVARVHCGRELAVRNRLVRAGVETFVPVRSEGGHERPILNAMVFLKATKTDALELANTGVVPVKYVIDCATRTLLVVPESLEEGGMMDKPLSLGDRVKVVKGPLKGVEGHVIEFNGRYYVVVSLLDSLFAKARVPRSWIERIGNK